MVWSNELIEMVLVLSICQLVCILKFFILNPGLTHSQRTGKKGQRSVSGCSWCKSTNTFPDDLKMRLVTIDCTKDVYPQKRLKYTLIRKGVKKALWGFQNRLLYFC